MRNLIRIQNAVYNKPWAILPSAHETIRQQLEQAIAGKIQMPDDEDENDAIVEEIVDELVAETETKQTAIISVEGIIGKHLNMLETMCGGVDVDNVAAELQASVDDPSISDIIMYFNSPGGQVVGVPELGEIIAKCKDKKDIYAYSDVMACSAAYWLMSQCTAVYVAPSADIGSVGVYSIYTDQTRALENEGIKVNAISAGKYKLTGAPFKVMSDEERAMLQADVDKIYEQFKATVTSTRDIKDEFLQGQVFDGETAVMNGFADGTVNSMAELLDVVGQIKQ